MTKEIILTRNMVAIVDNDFYEYLNQWNWYVYENNKKWRITYYAARNEGVSPHKKVVLMHRIIMSAGKKRKSGSYRS